MKCIFLFVLTLCAACITDTPSGNKAAEPSGSIAVQADTTLRKGTIIKSVSNRLDRAQSFCLYIPANADTSKTAAIFFFDPKGNGCFPVRKYQSAAERHGLILAGSHDSKNGLKSEQTAAIAKNFVNDLAGRLRINRSNIIACGFSGGARVAVQTAIRENLAGVIGCGAGFPFDPVRSYGFAYIGLVGNEDFNYLEMKRLDRKLQQLEMAHQLIVFDGEHQWPAPEKIEIALACLKDIRDNKRTDEDKELIELTERNSAYLASALQETEIERQEALQQAGIAQAFSRQDFRALKNKIISLSSLPGEQSKEQRLVNKRLLNFISLLGFIYSERALGIDLTTAGRYLDIYGQADSDNPDYHYLLACYHAKAGNENDALAALKQSIEYGFRDYKKAFNESMLQTLHNQQKFIILMDSLRMLEGDGL